MATIGTCEEYEAFIVASGTQIPLVTLPWSQISWGRLRSDISTASVIVSPQNGGVECCGAIGGLEPWDQMLRIERNGAIVWDGPVTGWREEAGTLKVRAMDRFCVSKKRYVGSHLNLVNSDPVAIIASLIASAAIGNPAYDIYSLTAAYSSASTETVSREYFVERLDTVYDAIREVVSATTKGFFTCYRDTVYLYEPQMAALVGANAPLVLSEQTMIGRPTVDVEGFGMATKAYVGGSSVGVPGFPLIGNDATFLGTYVAAFLETASAQSRTGSQADLNLMAKRLAAEAATPDATVERVRLSPNFGAVGFPADLSYLLPGVRVLLDFESTCAFNVPFVEYRETGGVASYATTSTIQYLRLDELEVSVTQSADGGLDETIMASFRTVAGLS